MHIAVLVARLGLFAVFATSGIAKLLDRRGTGQAVANFGVPARLAPAVALVLPPAELAAALLLLSQATAWLGGVGSLLLLTVFSLAIAVNIWQGRAPECNCFGQVHSEPISPLTLLRNAAFAVPALFLVGVGRSTPGPSAINWITEMNAPETALAVISLGLATGLALAVRALRSLRRQHDALQDTVRILEHLFDTQDGRGAAAAEPAPANVTAPAPLLEVGTLAPAFSLPASGGGVVSLNALVARRKPTLLLFVGRKCGPCHELLPKVSEWVSLFGEDVSVLAIAPGTEVENRELVSQFPGVTFAFSDSEPLAARYGAAWTPGAMVIDAYGHVRETIAFGGESILKMLDRVAADIEPVDAPAPVVPAFTALLPDGREVPAAEVRSATGTAFVYWRSTCPFCAELVLDLQRWAEQRPALAPDLVLLVREAEHAPDRFGAPIVLDPEAVVAQQVGLTGTPSAVFLDADGAVSFKVEGSPNIRALLGIPQPQPAAAAHAH